MGAALARTAVAVRSSGGASGGSGGGSGSGIVVVAGALAFGSYSDANIAFPGGALAGDLIVVVGALPFDGRVYSYSSAQTGTFTKRAFIGESYETPVSAALHTAVVSADTRYVNINGGTNSGQTHTFTAVLLRGVHATTPIDVAASLVWSGSEGTSFTAPGMTTVTPGALVLAGVYANHSAPGLTVPTGWTQQVASAGGTGTRQLMVSKAMAAAGATGDPAFTQAVAATGVAKWKIAIAPAAA